MGRRLGAQVAARMAYEVIEVKPMTRRIGAEISGVALESLGNRQVEEIHDALIAHQVIFFRDQTLSHDGLKALGRHFGKLAIHSGVPGLADHPEIVAIHADADSKFVAGESWHSDLSADAEPPLGSILYLPIVPESGGDTLFASMYAAYDALSPRMKTYLEGLSAIHDADHVYRALFPDLVFEVVAQVAENDQVASRWLLTGTNRGRRVSVWGITLSRLRDGRIVEDWTGFDSLDLIRKLGLVRTLLAAPKLLAASRAGRRR